MTLPNLDKLAKQYLRDVEWEILNNDEKRVFKNFVAGMRFGKTFYMINHHIPFIFENTDVRLVVCTAPNKGTIDQNTIKMKHMCATHGYAYAGNPKEAEKLLDKGNKVVMYVTNSYAYTTDRMISFLLKKVDEKLSICTFMDEAWTWTVDHRDNLQIVSGNAGGKDTYKATWYELMNKLSKSSQYTYGMSATETFQLDGKVPPIWGDMTYKNVVCVRDPKQLAHRLAWFGGVTYWNESNILPINGEPVTLKDDAFDMMISNLQKIKNKTGKKRTALIECRNTVSEDNMAKNPNKQQNPDTTESIEKRIIKSNYECDPSDYIGAILTVDNCYLFNKNGQKSSTKYDEDDIFEKLDDENDPLTFLVVKNMAKNGVTIRTLKEFFSFSVSDKSSELGLIYYSKNQAQGRTLTPNSGISNDEFYEKHGGSFLNTKPFHKELNTAYFYINNNSGVAPAA